MAHKVARYGWRPDLPDHRDYRVARLSSFVIAGLPPAEDLRIYCPPVYDQGDLGSCTANAACGAAEFMAAKQAEPDVRRSRLQVYYDERELEGSTGSDAGAYLRDAVKVLVSSGAAPEALWPYDISRFAVKPPPEVYAAAEKFQTLRYARLDQDVGQLRGCVAGGLPFMFGFTVYDSFESDQVTATGVVPMPGPNEKVLGGHAVVAVGYDDSASRFIVRNSWGTGWGQAGYCTMPYQYLADSNLSDDFWVLQMVE